jgi:hypothetical protein
MNTSVLTQIMKIVFLSDEPHLRASPRHGGQEVYSGINLSRGRPIGGVVVHHN